jgi:hypothetical protein
MTDHPHTREAIERWRQGKVNVFDALAELEDQRDAARAEIEHFRVATRELIRLLEIEEESDSGTPFKPNRISSCRVMDGMQMNQCLKKLKELAAE